MTETELYQKIVRPMFERQGRFVFRVEHARLPDVYTCKDGIVKWYELKVINKIPLNKIVVPDWRPGQLAWITEHRLKGGGDNIRLILWVYDRTYELMPKEKYSMEERDGQWFVQ